MEMEEIVAQWIAETDRVIDMVQHDFIQLDDRTLNYKVHVSRCNIRQIMQHVILTNKYLFDCIERAIQVAKFSVQQEDYHPGYLRKYILNRLDFSKCIPKRIIDQNIDSWEQSSQILFSKIIDQQNRIKELITLCKSSDMNRRVVPFGFLGLIKLSTAETFDYLILHQKSHFRMARHILMLQQV